ncbi:MAG: cupin domain-containing protein [Gemmatimonadales bacterium]|nr:cupin domain-containing protein [Gemmatimonadales bacterium]
MPPIKPAAADEFVFHGTRMRIHLRTPQTGGAYGLIEMWHPPAVGPALHVHPRGPESFLILQGRYTFTRDGETIVAEAGTSVAVPAGVAHRYQVGSAGGHAIVICPPGLEDYFEQVAERSAAVPLALGSEFTLAGEHGQEFLERGDHWS